MNFYRSLRKRIWQTSMIGLERGPHITRYSMYQRLTEVATKLPTNSGRILSISHSQALIDILRLQPTDVIEANYPEQNILALPYTNESFDFVISDQVLEHVEGNPQDAVNECHRVLKPGGIAIHTTCFINPIHGEPKDFWRYTPDALALLHQDWSRIIELGGWGNFQAWSVVQDGLRFEGIPHAGWHPLHRLAIANDPLWPITTWAIAQK